MTHKLSPGHSCPVCSGTVVGRSDKIYCSVQCKNKHHRESRRLNTPLTREQNRKLLRNLTLLEGLMREAKFMHIHKDELIKRGFDLNSVTGVEIQGTRYRLKCYHFSYTLSPDGILHVTRHVKVQENRPGFYERYVCDPVLGASRPTSSLSRRERRQQERKFRQRE